MLWPFRDRRPVLSHEDVPLDELVPWAWVFPVVLLIFIDIAFINGLSQMWGVSTSKELTAADLAGRWFGVQAVVAGGGVMLARGQRRIQVAFVLHIVAVFVILIMAPGWR